MTKQISVEDSIARILSTAVGTRVIRPEYGSRIHELIDKNTDADFRVKMSAYVYDAIEKNEPRAILKRVLVTSVEPFNILIEYLADGVDNTLNLGGLI